jgi:hypothetical protein
MAANISNHDPMFPIKTVSGNTELTKGDLGELAAQTFKRGVPVQVTAAGFVQQWDGATISKGIAGVSLQIGQNLPSNGYGAPSQGYGQVTGPKAIQTWGSVQNEANAVNIALGTPASDGRTLFAVANQDTKFRAMVDNSAGTNAASYTPTSNNMVGNQYGITFDASGQAYIDINKNTVGTNTVFQVDEYDPIDGNQVNGHVIGHFVNTASQFAQ